MEVEANKPVKKIGCSHVLGWVVGILFIVGGIGEIIVGSLSSVVPAGIAISGFFYLLAGLSVFPPFWKIVKEKGHFEISGALKVVLFFILIVISPFASIKSFGNNTSKSSNKVEQQIPNTNNSIKIESTTKPIATLVPTIAVLKVTTSEFISAFDKNQLAAEEKYKNQHVQFTAVISNISEDILGKPFLSLNPTSDKYYFGTHIQCFFNQKSDLTSLSNGQSITLQGIVNEQSLGIIVIKNCQVITSD